MTDTAQDEQRNVSLAEQIAHVTHDANRSYCRTIDDYSQGLFEVAPEWQRKSAIKGVQFHLDNHGASAEDSHKSWLEEKKKDGWKYGKVKDVEKKEHPCYVPYADLPEEQKIKDYIFSGIVKAFVDGLAVPA